MPVFWRSLPLSAWVLLLATAGYAQHTPVDKLLPCESLSQSAAVFVGVAGAPCYTVGAAAESSTDRDETHTGHG